MKYFYKKFELDINNKIYEPAEDSVLLADALYEYFKRKPALGKKALDMGIGSGIIAISLADIGFDVTACDINEQAILAAAKNAKLNGKNIRLVKSDLFSAFDKKNKFDVITFNPPYLESEDLLKNDYKESKLTYDGGFMGRELIIKFIKDSSSYISNDGAVFIIASSINDIDFVVNKFKEYYTKVEILKKEHIFFEDIAVIHAKGKKN